MHGRADDGVIDQPGMHGRADDGVIDQPGMRFNEGHFLPRYIVWNWGVLMWSNLKTLKKHILMGLLH